MFHTSRAALAFACALAFTAAHAASPNGSPAAESAAGRTIVLQPDTRHINVTRGETITIVRAGQRFSWHLDTDSHLTVFALATIAPKDMAVDGIKVYVAGNPLHAG